MPQLSATIIAYNEGPNLVRAIRSLACADEVIVVDSGSTDNTCELASSLGARVVRHAWPGFAAQKNFAAELASHDWILSLDADEELDLIAQRALGAWKRAEPAAAGYRFRRRARYLGRWILHSGWYPDFKLRLFDRRAGRWEGDYVHESVTVRGPVETLPGEILHYTCDSVAEHRQRIEFYAQLAAQEMIERGEGPGLVRRWLAPPWVFTYTYFFRLGVLDGVPGFYLARMAARYVRRKYSRWRELQGAPWPEEARRSKLFPN